MLRIKIKGPDGKERFHYSKNILTAKGAAIFEIPVALNDPKGRWIVEAQDVISGHIATGYYDVQ